MKKVILFFVSLIIWVTPLLADSFYDVTVIRIQDAKTLIVDIKNLPPVFGASISVELSGISVPQSNGQCVAEAVLAYEAKRLIGYMLEDGSIVTLLNVTRDDDSFKLIGRIEIGGEDLGDFLISESLALPYHSDSDPFVWCQSEFDKEFS
jgi:hypothetical protein